ncbi:hypothetical protein HPB47_011721 [Ixodes persulcatus]|uniref:Uncharacterized protein n=1 Tax=Ixodes persulcatus TaxID=34615 RepID=A0AC60NVR2_IXOPE|nr:hypothetical protein HPB47_011721 [Ixodes persulcatus]
MKQSAVATATPSEEEVSSRYLHASAITDDFLLVLGGRNRSGEAILESFAYDLSCNHWIPLEDSCWLLKSRNFLRLRPKTRPGGWAPGSLKGQAVPFSPERALERHGGASQTCGRPGSRPPTVGGGVGRVAAGPGLPGRGWAAASPGAARDLCGLFSHSRLGCLRSVGCSFCSAQDGANDAPSSLGGTECLFCSCLRHRGTLEVAPGKLCGAAWLANRTCAQFSSCEDCLASWPGHGVSGSRAPFDSRRPTNGQD